MAKKSAKSKGYRHFAGKRPYLTKRDIIILCALIAVVAVGAIALFSYDDGALKYKDGKIVDSSENWVIVNGAVNGGRRYYKLAEAGELEGYTRESEPVLGDANLNTLRYTPTDKGSIKSITLSATAAKAQRVAEYYRSIATALNPTEVQTAQAGDVAYQYFTYKSAYYEEDAAAAEAPADEAAAEETPAAESDEAAAEETPADESAEAAAESDDETPAPNHFDQALFAYVDATHDSSVGIGIIVDAASEDDFLTEDQLKDVAAQAIGALKLEEKK